LKNLIDTDAFKRCKQPLLDAGVITEEIRLSDKYNELFYSYKGQYVMESLMYPMFMLFKSTNLGDVETEYFHIILNMFVNEHPEYLESIEAEKKFAERSMRENKWQLVEWPESASDARTYSNMEIWINHYVVKWLEDIVLDVRYYNIGMKLGYIH